MSQDDKEKATGGDPKLIVAVQMLSIGIILLILGLAHVYPEFRRQDGAVHPPDLLDQHGQHHRRRPGLRHQRRDPLPAGQEDMNILRFAPRFSDAAGVVSKFCAKSLRVPAAAELVYLPFVLFKYSIKTSGFAGKQKTAPGLFLVDLVQATPMNIRAGTVFSTEGNMTGS